MSKLLLKKLTKSLSSRIFYANVRLHEYTPVRGRSMHFLFITLLSMSPVLCVGLQAVYISGNVRADTAAMLTG